MWHRTSCPVLNGLRAALRQGFIFFWVGCFSFCAEFPARSQTAAADDPAAGAVNLKLSEYLRLVLARNEALQAQMLETESFRRKARAEYGTFEPDLVLNATRENNRRQNNVQQQTELDSLPIWDEQNRTYDGSIESLVPTGAKLRLGTTLADLHNNLPFILSTNLIVP
ncbi:MAG TPA: hypothetical protein VHH88_08950, partial [Verrucomicrobiae bacterium]|nr:hypothetical protein [Verrucomicrobiae bacterium]